MFQIEYISILHKTYFLKYHYTSEVIRLIFVPLWTRVVLLEFLARYCSQHRPTVLQKQLDGKLIRVDIMYECYTLGIDAKTQLRWHVGRVCSMFVQFVTPSQCIKALSE